MVWQLERGDASGAMHLQGYVEFGSSFRLGDVKRALCRPDAHLEQRRGSKQQAIEYCTKEETRFAGPWIFGTSTKQGKRSDLIGLCSEIVEGSLTISEVRRNYPKQYVLYRRGVEALCAASAKEKTARFREVQVFVYYGESGAGKTRKAVEENENYYMLEQGEKTWFDGYEGESCLIIDEFYGWILWGFFLRLLDGYQCRLPVKGGFCYAQWSKVIITSNQEPREWYARGMPRELRRRISEIWYFKLNQEPEKLEDYE